MDTYFLAGTALFQGAAEEEIGQMLRCLDAEERFFEKGAVICRAGEPAKWMGIILSGSVNIENDDIWGNRSILDHVGPGQVFAETYACLPEEPMMVNVAAAEDTWVLLLRTQRLFQPGREVCGHQARLIRNLLSVSAQKNLVLSRRIFHTSSKTIRGRLLSYLSFQARRQGGKQITIPFNRQQLADYLGVDRSALSKEMGKMRDEGLIAFERNYFKLMGEEL